MKHLRLREQRRQPLQKFAQKAPQSPALKPPSTARTAGRSDRAERRFRRQPFILLFVTASSISLISAEKGENSLIPLRLLFPPNPLRWASAGALLSSDNRLICPKYAEGAAHMAWESPLQRGSKSYSHKRRNVRFNGLRRVHTPPQPLTAHTAAHRAKQGRFGWGRYHYPRTVLRGSETLRGRVSERHTLPLLSLGRGALSKNAESLRDSDAFMRVAVPRRRGPAGLRCPLLHPAPHRPSLRFVTLAPRRRERITACVIHRTVPPALPAPCFAQRIRLTRRAAAHRIAP